MFQVIERRPNNRNVTIVPAGNRTIAQEVPTTFPSLRRNSDLNLEESRVNFIERRESKGKKL